MPATPCPDSSGGRMNARKLIPAAALLVLAGCADDDGIGALQPEGISTSPVVPVDASAELADPEGSKLGTAEFTDQADGVQVDVEVHGMTTGAHQVRLVAVGECPPAAGSEQIGTLPAGPGARAGGGPPSPPVGFGGLGGALARG